MALREGAPMMKLNTWASMQLRPEHTVRIRDVVPITISHRWLAFEIVLREAARVGVIGLVCAKPNDAADMPGYTMSVELGGPASDAVERAHSFNEAVRAALTMTPGAWPP
jgi:hypothetical protein